MGSGRMGGLGGALFGCCWEVVRTGGVDLKCLVASQFPDTANTGRVWLLLQADRRGSSPLGERLSVDPPWSSGRAACSAQKALSAAIAARVRPCLPHTSTDFGTAADLAGPVRRRRARIGSFAGDARLRAYVHACAECCVCRGWGERERACGPARMRLEDAGRGTPMPKKHLT